MAAGFGYNFCWIYLCFSFQGNVAQFSGWDEYITSWEETAWSSRMYPFGEMYFDSTITAGDGQDGNINFIIPFYGSAYSAAYISTIGHIELSNTNPATNTRKPLASWPNQDYPNTPDVPFIAPYYSHFEMSGLPDDPGSIYWRRVSPSEEEDPVKLDIANNMISWLSENVQQYVVGAEDFWGQNALIVTWNQIRFYACVSENCPTNTVQAAIVTDSHRTYVTYNYYELTWLGSVKQGYDLETGLQCSANCIPGQAGFNAGEARAFYALPFSHTSSVLNLAITSGTGVPGRFIYQVDSFDIVRGGCSNISEIDPVDWPVELSPTHGTMLGGQAIYVSGPCFMESSTPTIYCMFGDNTVEGWFIPDDYTRAICVTPFMIQSGPIQLKLSTNGLTWPYTGTFYVDLPAEVQHPITLDKPEHWHNKSAEILSFHWDPTALLDDYERNGNKTPPEFTVDICLCAYMETVMANASSGELQEIHIFVENVPNSGEYSFIVQDHQCPAGEECQWMVPLPTGLISVRRRGPGTKPRTIWSEPFPLGWYGNDAWNRWHGENWPEQICMAWMELEKQDMSWQHDLKPCPVTEAHAVTDQGQFMPIWHPCNSSTSTICLSCYEQITPHTNMWPSVSHCCYDGAGHIVYASDAPVGGGSLSAKVSSRGDIMAPNGKTPMLSHYTWDSVLEALCCHWTMDPVYCQELYEQVRPTRDVSEYKSPRSTTAFGDPHFRTYDGVEYTFNGRGEYWLLQVFDMELDLDNINIQARLEKPSPENWGEVKATIMTSIVIQEGYADDMTVPTIEVLMAESEAMVSLVLLINGEAYDFRPRHSRKMYIPYRDYARKIMIINNEETPDADNRQSNFTIIYPSGIMVQVAHVEGAIHIISSLPHRYRDKTLGLFGIWNDNIDDDLTPPGGSPIDHSQGNEFIHNNFGVKWVISDASSRFTYTGSLTAVDYHDPDFVPFFTEPVLPPNSTLTESEVDEACGTNFVCRFDYKTSMSRELAVTSASMQTWTSHIVEQSMPVPVCSYLEIPHSYREVTHYTAGGSIVVTGCADEYTLMGITEYTCVVQDGIAQWQPTPDTLCKANSVIAQENKDLAIKIAVPICCVLAAAGIATGGYFLYRHKNKKKIDEAAPRSNQFSYSTGGTPGSSVSSIGPNIMPVPLRQPENQPELLRRGKEQRNTLSGCADLGSCSSFTDSEHIDTRLQSTDGTTGLTPNGIIDNPGISMSPDYEYAQEIQNRSNELRSQTSRGFEITDYESSGCQPRMQSLSASEVSINQGAPQDGGYSEIVSYSHPNRSHTLDSSDSQLDSTQLQLHQSQLNQSQLQLHPEPVMTWSANQPDPPFDPTMEHSGPDLIQLANSKTNLNQIGQTNSLSTNALNKSELSLSAARLSQSQHSLHQSQLSLTAAKLSQSQQSLHQSVHNTSLAKPMYNSQGYTNLCVAASMHSINLPHAQSSESMHQNHPASHASLHQVGGHDNVAMTTAEFQGESERPASRFAAYAADYGNNTVV